MRTLTLRPFGGTRNFSNDLWREMDRFFDLSPVRLATGASSDGKEIELVPATDIVEHEKSYSLSVDLPGLKREDIKIEVVEDRLTVSGERKREKKTESEKVQRFEKVYGYFARSFTLPDSVDATKIEAQFENGVLELTLPKAEVVQPKKIEVQIKN